MNNKNQNLRREFEEIAIPIMNVILLDYKYGKVVEDITDRYISLGFTISELEEIFTEVCKEVNPDLAKTIEEINGQDKRILQA